MKQFFYQTKKIRVIGKKMKIQWGGTAAKIINITKKEITMVATLNPVEPKAMGFISNEIVPLEAN